MLLFQATGGQGSGVEPVPCCWKVAGSPGLHDKVSLCKILNPKLLLMCWSAPCTAATAINVWMYVWITVSQFRQKCLLNALKLSFFLTHSVVFIGIRTRYIAFFLFNTFFLLFKTRYLHYPWCNFSNEWHHWRRCITLHSASSGAFIQVFILLFSTYRFLQDLYTQFNV